MDCGLQEYVTCLGVQTTLQSKATNIDVAVVERHTVCGLVEEQNQRNYMLIDLLLNSSIQILLLTAIFQRLHFTCRIQ